MFSGKGTSLFSCIPAMGRQGEYVATAESTTSLVAGSGVPHILMLAEQVEMPCTLVLGSVRLQCAFRSLHSILLHLLVLCLGSGRELFEVAPA